MPYYEFGNLITRLREQKGYSQFQLGRLVGVSDKAVSKWENGKAVPRMATCQRLAEVLETDVYQILNCTLLDRKRQDADETASRETDRVGELMKEIRNYEQMIHDAEGALDSAEKELNEILDAWAVEDRLPESEENYYPSMEETEAFLKEYPPVPQPWEPEDPGV